MLNRRGAPNNSLLSRYSQTAGELMLRRHSELAMQSAKIESDMANRAKSAFLATMSHELRTPLNAIIGFSDLIRHMKASPQAVEEGKDYAVHISNAGRHLLEVVSDILDISKIESGTFTLSLEPSNLADIIDSAVVMVSERVAAKQQRLQVRIPKDLPDLAVDARRIRQILINLLANAHKFTAERGQILVIAQRIRNGSVTIAVADTGCGMDRDQLKIAMTPFGQVQSHFTRTQEGTGLGLPIALGLAREHGGDLTLESEPGAGTTAVLTLPPRTGALLSDPNFFTPKRDFAKRPPIVAAPKEILLFEAIDKKPPVRERRGVPAEAPVRIAHVVSVSGSHAVAILERSAEPVLRSKDPRIQIGSVVKILTPGASVIGLVSSVSSPMPDLDGKKEEMGLIEINLAGETRIDDGSRRLAFHRGVASLPSLGDPIYLADKHDLTRIYAPPGVASIKVGTLFQNSDVPARLMVDDLLSKHFIVVGSTGSGKSSALSILLQRLLEDTAGAHVVILDIHNEYGAAFGNLVEHITLENFNLPLWMLNFQELTVALASNEGTRDEEIEILSEGILAAKKRYADAAAGRAALLSRRPGDIAVITVDTPAPFRLSDVIAYLDEQLGKLERTRASLPYRRLKARIEQLVADQRYAFMFGGLTVQDTMTQVLSRLFRIPNDGKPISVIDLSTVPHEILDVVISVISRLAFDLAVWSKGGLPMLLVCEEAHRYAPANDGKFVPTRQALGRIAKEGRKYGISLALVTQRPSELDSTILSQCSTAIALRLSSEKDQQVIRGSTYEGMLDLIDFLPLLGDREALILGQGVSMPMRIRFDELSGKRPKNMNIGFSKSWKTQNMDRDMLENIITRWRTTGRERPEDKF